MARAVATAVAALTLCPEGASASAGATPPANAFAAPSSVSEPLVRVSPSNDAFPLTASAIAGRYVNLDREPRVSLQEDMKDRRRRGAHSHDAGVHTASAGTAESLCGDARARKLLHTGERRVFSERNTAHCNGSDRLAFAAALVYRPLRHGNGARNSPPSEGFSRDALPKRDSRPSSFLPARLQHIGARDRAQSGGMMNPDSNRCFLARSGTSLFGEGGAMATNPCGCDNWRGRGIMSPAGCGGTTMTNHERRRLGAGMQRSYPRRPMPPNQGQHLPATILEASSRPSVGGVQGNEDRFPGSGSRVEAGFVRGNGGWPVSGEGGDGRRAGRGRRRRRGSDSEAVLTVSAAAPSSVIAGYGSSSETATAGSDISGDGSNGSNVTDRRWDDSGRVAAVAGYGHGEGQAGAAAAASVRRDLPADHSGSQGGTSTVQGVRPKHRGGRGGGGVRSGGVLSPVLHPYFDRLDLARGQKAMGVAAMKVLEEVEKAGWDGIRFSALRLGKIVAGAAAAGRWKSHGRPLVERMEAVGVSPGDVRSWTALVLPLSRLGYADECLEMLDMMHAALDGDRRVHRGPPGGEKVPRSAASERQEELITVTHNHCMFAFIKAGRHEEAVAHFDQFFRRSQPTDEDLWINAMQREEDEKRQREGEGVIIGDESLNSPDQGIIGDSEAARVEEATGSSVSSYPSDEIWGESELPPDIFSYTHLLSSLEKLGRHRACLSALQEMRARGIKGDTYTYVSAIKALGAAGLWESAVGLLAELRELEGVSPDIYVYTAAISACSTAGRWEEALTLEGDMRKRGINPNAYTVTSCISALARGGEWERAVWELEAAEEDDLPVSTPAYNAALKAFAIGKALEPGLAFYRKMRREGRVPMEEKTHNIAIELCKECGDTSKALSILRSMTKAGFPPSVVSYNTALGACEVAGNYQLALKLLQEMKGAQKRFESGVESRFEPEFYGSETERPYNDGGRRHGRQGDQSQAGDTTGGRSVDGVVDGVRATVGMDNHRQGDRCRIAPDHWTYNIALATCAKAGQWGIVHQLLKEMDTALGQGVGEAVLGCVGGGERGYRDGDAEVHEMIAELRSRKDGEGSVERAVPSRNFITFATLIMAADAGGEPQRCLEHYAEMGRWGLAPNGPVYAAVSRACLALRSWRWATLVHRDATARQSAVPWTACAAAVGMMASGETSRGTRMLGGVARGDGVLDADGGGETEEFDTLNAAAGHAVKAMARAGDWIAVRDLFEAILEVTQPSMQLKVMYIRAQAALASSAESGATRAPSPPGDDNDRSPTANAFLLSPADERAGARAALTALEKLDGLGLEIGEREHSAALFACAGRNSFPFALSVLRSMREKGLECDGRAGAHGLIALTREEEWGTAAQLADDIALTGIAHTPYSATAMITAYGRTDRWEDALNVLDDLLEADEDLLADEGVEGRDGDSSAVVTTAVFNAGIMACGRAGELEEGMHLLRLMWEKGVQRDVQTYNTAMALCKSVGGWTRAVGLLEVMEAEGIAPDVVTYNTVISSCEAGADHWTAFSVFNQMQDAGITPDIWTYNSLANVLGSCGEWERAIGLLDDMRATGLKPDVVTYSTLVGACEKAGQIEASLALLEEMTREGVLKNEVTFSTAVKALSCAGSPSSATQNEDSWLQVAKYHEEAKKRGMANVVTYSAVINVCAKKKRWKDALSLLHQMREEGIEPNDYSFSAAMWACVNADEGQRALQLFATIMDTAEAQTASTSRHTAAGLASASGYGDVEGVGSDHGGGIAVVGRSRDCYMAAITACQKSEDFPRALALLQHMRRKGVRGSLGLYNLVLSMCQQFGDADTSKKLLTLMRLDRVSPSVVSCNQVIRACEKAGRWEDALAILRAMVAGGVRPNVYTVSSALRASCVGHSPERAVALLRELRGVMGTALSLPVYNTLICSFHREGRYDLADFFYREAHEEGEVQHWETPTPITIFDEALNRGRELSVPVDTHAMDGGVQSRVMDLHGHSLPLAHAAVRFALEEVWRYSQKEGTALGDLTIITGVGRGSLHAFQPVVRPEVQRMLLEEFYPPIDSATEVGNAGRVIVKAEAIETWLDHNVEAKRPVMARLAAALQKKAQAVGEARGGAPSSSPPPPDVEADKTPSAADSLHESVPDLGVKSDVVRTESSALSVEDKLNRGVDADELDGDNVDLMGNEVDRMERAPTVTQGRVNVSSEKELVYPPPPDGRVGECEEGEDEKEALYPGDEGYIWEEESEANEGECDWDREGREESVGGGAARRGGTASRLVLPVGSFSRAGMAASPKSGHRRIGGVCRPARPVDTDSVSGASAGSEA